jgi:hypothetical protein
MLILLECGFQAEGRGAAHPQVDGCVHSPSARGELSRVRHLGDCVQADLWFLLSKCGRDKQRSVGSLCRAQVGRRLER